MKKEGLRDDTPDEAAEPSTSPDPSPVPVVPLVLVVPPVSPLPLDPTGDWGMA